MAKQAQAYDEKSGKPICGAKNKSTVNKRGKPRKNLICHRTPMKNGRCPMHGGKSTGPKNSIGYYKKTLLGDDNEALKIQNPLDLLGDIALVRTLLTRMADNPLKAYCQDCRQWVIVNIECPNKEYNNEQRINDGKRAVQHHVSVKDNDYGDMVKATKLLSDVAKNHKEIQKGKEITLRVEIINVLVNRVIEAYNEANKFGDPSKRRTVFVERLEQLVPGRDEVASPSGT